MKRRSLLIISAVIALSAIMLISAAAIFSLNFDMNATVPPTGAVTVTIGSTTYSDDESLSIDWGTVTPGTPMTTTVIINNGANYPVTPAIEATGLPTAPSGWSLTLNDTSTIPAYTNVTRDIVLTVPIGALAGTPSWTAKLTASS